MSHTPPRNFHDMRRALRENRRRLDQLEDEYGVEKFFTLLVKVNEKPEKVDKKEAINGTDL